ncbi:AAA family ATPase [Lentzea sp. NPDC051213]|uniref:helix-turn-helix transcriptional regulator n=1 Tax=Lentzea sp. NPDC051213 TaxID=3364126 RepID=UPI0037985806
MPAASTEGLAATGLSGDVLLDRDDDLGEIDRALARALTGDGQVLLIEGAPGIGKTTLLAELRGRARGGGMTVLAARGGELERGFGFGIVRQLLEAQVAGATEDERDRLLAGAARLATPVFTAADVQENSGDVTYATLHGLYWLVANLAERAPLVLSVDDAHWADAPSLRFLDHLAHRLDGLPVIIALTARSGSAAHREDLRSLTLEAALTIQPRPLSDAAVGLLVEAGLGDDAPVALRLACRKATGGNPFLLSELLRELRRGADADPAVVPRIGPERIAASVLLRVSRLHPAAPAFTRAVAVLGHHATLANCCRLAELSPALARSLVDSLADLGVLEDGDPLRFVHPIVRTAIYDDVPAAERSVSHAAAARVLADLHADPEAIAVHLLSTHPAGDPAVVKVLLEAARRTMSSGAPDTAAALLRRAIAEPPPDGERPEVVLALARAEHELNSAEAPRLFLLAAEDAADPVVRARALIGFAWAVHPDVARLRPYLDSWREAASAVRAQDREIALELEAARLGALLFSREGPTSFEDEVERFRDLPGRTAAECLLLSFVARKALAERHVAEAVAFARRAAAHPTLTSHAGHPLWRTNIIFPLMAGEQYDLAEHILSQALLNAERSGSPQWLGRIGWLRTLIRHRRGDLRGAEADARLVIERQLPGRGNTASILMAQVLLDQGRAGECAAMLAERGLGGGSARDDMPSVWLLTITGRLKTTLGDLDGARSDLEGALERVRNFRNRVPNEHDIRVALVSVLHALGDEDAASTAADDALEAATATGVRRAMGGALRVSGLVRGGAAGLEQLRHAVEILAESPSLLWRAEALVDYGAALRRQGQRTAAREPLREGMDLAHRCGAASLTERAAGELRAAGARPRRMTETGADALTPSERRVAELAAAGKTNKDIAQSLFVTLRTVEMHLSNAYAKLGIDSRQGLAQALA